MSSAKAALESDTRVLAYEAGRKWGVRVNTISAGPLGSRAAKAIGFIDDMIRRAPAGSAVFTSLDLGSVKSERRTDCMLNVSSAKFTPLHHLRAGHLISRHAPTVKDGALQYVQNV